MHHASSRGTPTCKLACTAARAWSYPHSLFHSLVVKNTSSRRSPESATALQVEYSS